MFIADEINSLKFTTLNLELQEQTLLVVISRPAALNALSQTVIAELRELFGLLLSRLGQGAEPDWSVRGVVLTGAGEKSFVAGADITEMQQMSAAQAAAYAVAAQELTRWFAQLPVPVIAAVNGYALGGGCELALACDYVYAAANALFGQPEVGLGLIPGFGGTVRLFRAVGPALARELIYTGRKISAQQAFAAGLVNEVHDSAAATVAAAVKSVQLAAQQSPTAVASAKQVLREVEFRAVADGLAVEAAAFAECFNTADMREGTAAFVAKRRPSFTGQRA